VNNRCWNIRGKYVSMCQQRKWGRRPQVNNAVFKIRCLYKCLTKREMHSRPLGEIKVTLDVFAWEVIDSKSLAEPSGCLKPSEYRRVFRRTPWVCSKCNALHRLWKHPRKVENFPDRTSTEGSGQNHHTIEGVVCRTIKWCFKEHSSGRKATPLTQPITRALGT